jgi:2',3'-cyclic-nucleotide 2'-phosphodiesterase (5'-nucleotidase family)
MFLLLLISFSIIFIHSKTIKDIFKNIGIDIPNNNQNNNKNEELFEIDDYEHITQQDSNYFYIPVFGTSDIHGHFYPEDFEVGQHAYSQGGLDYLGKYVNIIRDEFKNQFLYLDAGDIFQGGAESFMSNGNIILDYFNLIHLNGSTFGNHEFDYNRSYIEQKVKDAKFPFLSTNIYDTVKRTKKAFGENHFPNYIYTSTVPNDDEIKEKVQIKIGVIGLALNLTKDRIAGGGFDNIKFYKYEKELIADAKKLREENGVKAVILLSHIGIICGKGDNLTLNMYKPTDEEEECKDNLYELIKDLDEGIIDAIVTGHSHKEAHHFVKGIPVISPINNGIYANIIYLAFDKNNNYALEKSKIRIEGPLPICAKIFEKTKRCDFVKNSEIDEYLPLTEYKFHGIKIEKDPMLQPIHDKYDKNYSKYNETVCTITGTEEVLRTYLNGSYYLGNIITDIQKFVTGADISILSYGILRTSWNPGKIPLFKVQSLLPFENDMCTFIMNGNEVKRMMKTLQTGFKKYYMTSGIKQIMAKDENGQYFLADVKLFDGFRESELLPNQEYVITANSYFSNGGDDFFKVMKWYKPRNLNCEYGKDFNITEAFLRAQKTIDVRKYLDEDNKRIRFFE